MRKGKGLTKNTERHGPQYGDGSREKGGWGRQRRVNRGDMVMEEDLTWVLNRHTVSRSRVIELYPRNLCTERRPMNSMETKVRLNVRRLRPRATCIFNGVLLEPDIPREKGRDFLFHFLLHVVRILASVSAVKQYFLSQFSSLF